MTDDATWKKIIELLKRHAHDPPSLCLHLYSTYFKFEHEVYICDIVCSNIRRLTFFYCIGWFLFIQESI